MSTELETREKRAKQGIIQFAEEMQAIRDGNLYPGAKAKGEGDSWATYCSERWSMSKTSVNETIRALPVLKRFMDGAAGHEELSVSAAAEVSELPESVQDAILNETTRRDVVRTKARAARQTTKQAKAEGRDATDDELIKAAKAAKPTPKAKREDTRAETFVSHLAIAEAGLTKAADEAHTRVLDDVENEAAWNKVERFEYQVARLKERLHRPVTTRDVDVDEEFSKLLATEGLTHE